MTLNMASQQGNSDDDFGQSSSQTDLMIAAQTEQIQCCQEKNNREDSAVRQHPVLLS
jgi:hypothetical protein